jgi:hypothetical protein
LLSLVLVVQSVETSAESEYIKKMKNIAAYINKETTSQAGGYIMGVTDAITMDDNYNFIGAWPGKYRDSTQGIGDFDDF